MAIVRKEQVALTKIFERLTRLFGFRDEVLTSVKFGDLLGRISHVEGDLITYVNGSTGDDSYDGSASHPLKTMKEALKRQPTSWSGRNEIRVAAGTYAVDAAGSFDPVLGRYQGDLGTPLAIVGEQEDVLGTLTSTSAAATSITDNTLTPTLNQYRGYCVLITSGAAAGQMRLIKSNTTGGQFVFKDSMSPAPSAGATFKIIGRGTIFSMASGWVMPFSFGPVGYKNIKFAVNGTIMGHTDGTRVAAMENCHIDLGGATMAFRRGAVGILNSGSATWGTLGSDNPFNSLSNAGVYITNGTVNFDDSSICVGAHIIADDVTFNLAGIVGLSQPNFLRCTVNVTSGVTTVTSSSGVTAAFDSQKSSSSTTGIVNVTGNGRFVLTGGGLVLSNSGGDGLLAELGGKVDLTANSAVISGSGNTGVGLRLDRGGQGYGKSGVVQTVSGSGGELKVGANAAVLWSSVYPGVDSEVDSTSLSMFHVK